MPKFRGKLLDVDAFRWSNVDPPHSRPDWFVDACNKNWRSPGAIWVNVLEYPKLSIRAVNSKAVLAANVGDYIVRDSDGNIWPYTPEVFKATFMRLLGKGSSEQGAGGLIGYEAKTMSSHPHVDSLEQGPETEKGDVCAVSLTGTLFSKEERLVAEDALNAFGPTLDKQLCVARDSMEVAKKLLSDHEGAVKRTKEVVATREKFVQELESRAAHLESVHRRVMGK